MKKPSKAEIQEEMELHNADEVGIDNQWTLEDAEYHLLLSDKYYVKEEYHDIEWKKVRHILSRDKYRREIESGITVGICLMLAVILIALAMLLN